MGNKNSNTRRGSDWGRKPQKLGLGRYLVFDVSSAGLGAGEEEQRTHSLAFVSGLGICAGVSQPSSLCIHRKDPWSGAKPPLQVG